VPVSLPGAAPARRSTSELWGAVKASQPGMPSPRVRISVTTGSTPPPPPAEETRDSGQSDEDSRTSWGKKHVLGKLKAAHQMKHSIDRKTKHHSLAKKPSGRALVNEPPSKWAVAPKIGRLNLFGAKDKGYHNIEPPALLRLFIEAPD